MARRTRAVLQHPGLSLITAIAAILTAAILSGCASRPKPSPTTQPIVVDKPVLDFSRGIGALPLEGDNKPRSREELAQRLLRGYQSRLLLPEGLPPIVASGDSFPHLNQLRIDVSNAVVQKNYKPAQTKTPIKHLEPVLSVNEFEYLAAPLRYADRETYWQLRVHDARFGLFHDPSGRTGLVMTDAAEGYLQFSVKLSDLKPMMLRGAREHAKGGFWVRDAAVRITSEDTRSLSAELRVQAVWMLLPTTFHIRGHMTIDDNFHVKLSDLACEGEDLGGSLLASLIGPSIQKYEGRLVPLAKWPGDRIAVRDVAIHVDDAFRMTAWFGQRNSSTPLAAEPSRPSPFSLAGKTPS
ncbi:MAG: hypothetical protein ACM359_17945 [Bacillota bacterium]